LEDTNMTKAQRDRLDAIRERLRKARRDAAQARQAVAAAEGLRDADAAAVATARLDALEADIGYLQGLENAALMQAGSGNSLDRFGGNLAGNLDAQRVLAEIAESSAPIRSSITVGNVMGMDDVIGMTGGALRAVVDAPDRGGRAEFLGVAPTPQVPTSLLDFFTSVPFDGRTADLLRRSGVANAAIAPHGTVKPEAGLVYAAETIRAVTVAGWAKANRQDLDDTEALAADIDQALRYGVLRAVERRPPDRGHHAGRHDPPPAAHLLGGAQRRPGPRRRQRRRRPARGPAGHPADRRRPGPG
jgi:hypothetical protein